MSEEEEKFLVRLHGTFCREVLMHAQTMRSLLEQMQATHGIGDCAPLLRQLLRAVHSLKGAAGAVNQSELEYLSHTLEQALARLQRGDKQISEVFLALLRRSTVLIEQIAQSNSTATAPVVPPRLIDEIHRYTEADTS